MEKVYRIKQLHCAHCASKIETMLKNHALVEAARIDFMNQKLYITTTLNDEQILQAMQKIEKEVELEQLHVHTHCHGSCCSHDHHEHHNDQVIHGAQKYYIQGLDCANCASKVEAHLASLKEVEDVSLHFSSGILYIKTKHLNQAQIQEEINKIEHGVVLKEQKETVRTKDWMKLVPLFIAIVLFGIAHSMEHSTIAFWFYLASYFVAGSKVLVKAIRNISHKDLFDENFLMSVATLGAFFIQAYEEAIAVMVFYEIGEWFQSLAVDKSRTSITQLMDLKVEQVSVLVNGEVKVKDVEQVSVNELIVVKAGERVALDGIIVEGSALMDTSSLTGESKAVALEVGDEVLSGMLSLDARLVIRVSKTYDHSTLAKIMEQVEHASSKKAKMERFITKFAKVYTPIVVGGAVLFFVLASVLVPSVSYQVWLYRALTFLVVSCPCALVISIPLGLFASIGAASREGALIKGGTSVEALSKVDHIVFDKTGTITKGNFVIDYVECEQYVKEDMIRLAAYAESNSTHPIAKAICNEYHGELDPSKVQDVKEVAGKGISLIYENQLLLVGNEKLLQQYQISYPSQKQTNTFVLVAYNGVYCGAIYLKDEIKETSKDVIAQLQQQGISQCTMISGDQECVVQQVANEVGISNYYANVLPNEKVELVEALLNNKKANTTLAFVGDGMNDAPVLARADLAISMGLSGSDAAIEASDIVLMNDDLQTLVKAIRISKKTIRILYQNIIFSLAIKGLILALSAFGIASMWWGVFGDVGVTILAILNSMRILQKK